MPVNGLCRSLQGRCDKQQLQNEAFRAATVPLERQIAELEGVIGGLEAASKQRLELIEQRTREISALNRKVEQMIAARGPDVHTGTLPCWQVIQRC